MIKFGKIIIRVAIVAMFLLLGELAFAQGCDGSGGGGGDPGGGSGDDCDRCELCGYNNGEIGYLCPFCPAYTECLYLCPLIIDMEGDGFRFGGPQQAVSFDMLATGTPDRIQWVLPDEDDAFLGMDLNDNGLIDNGSELFGNGTEIFKTGKLARNGFLALAQYDHPQLGGNDDGKITDADQIWNLLVLWRDANADGVSQPSEMISMEEVNIKSLGIIPFERMEFDQHENWYRFYSRIQIGRQHPQGKVERNRTTRFLDIFFRKVFLEDNHSNHGD